MTLDTCPVCGCLHWHEGEEEDVACEDCDPPSEEADRPQPPVEHLESRDRI